MNELTCGEVNCKLSAAVCPGLRVTGVVIPEEVKSEPAIDMPEIVTGAVPTEESVSDWVAVCPAVTLPKLIVVVLALRVGIAAAN